MPDVRLDATELQAWLRRRPPPVLSGNARLDVRLVPSTGSTNADLVRLATRGAPEGLVLVTDHQTAGRGRLERRWDSPPGSGLALSILVRPPVPRDRWSWLPLVAGVALVEAMAELDVTARLKWPNDVLVDGRKLAGILVEVADHARAAVVGIGLNLIAVPAVAASTAIPLSEALLRAGPLAPAAVDPAQVLAVVLHRFAATYELWRGDGGAVALSAAYVEHSGTLGRTVAVTLPGGAVETGVARGIDTSGALVLETDDGPRTYAAGDVEHLRRPRS